MDKTDGHEGDEDDELDDKLEDDEEFRAEILGPRPSPDDFTPLR